MRKVKYAIAAVFDTETCNLGNTADTARAIPVLYIDNDIRDIDLMSYTPDIDDNINFLRFEAEYIERIEEYVRWGKINTVVPIICAYNLMFDLRTLLQTLNELFDIEVNAQSSSNVYTLDLLDKDSNKPLLRFWDTFHLDMRGLSKMGEVAGLAKATGSWDYDLIRTPYTELTDEEYFYAGRDTQVIPMYLRFLLNTNDWMKQADLGCRVLTKTSLVRQMAKHDIGHISITKQDGKKITVEKMFLELCKNESPKTYNSYAIRKACFRGGFTFTSAAYASTIQRNVVSVDVTSMHHTFINGRFIPVKFSYKPNEQIMLAIENILGTTREEVLENYHKPFMFAIHARIRISGIRIKEKSAFATYGIGLCPLSKFKHMDFDLENESRYASENAIIENGWADGFKNATFAFGKLYKADEITIHVNEIELWCLSRVYEWDSLECIYGESTAKFDRPPDYVTLQSNILYKLKDDNKFITEHYIEGKPYPYNIPDAVPAGYAEMLRKGSLLWADFNAYYISNTKGLFNAIFGTQAQDIYRPSYKCENGIISVDAKTIIGHENWSEKKKESGKVLYTYGMRIVAGSRLHMVIAIERIFETFGDSARVLGGDTDSMKISFDNCVTDEQIMDSLDIFQTCSKNAIDKTMERVRKLYPNLASTLRGVGGFTNESEGNHYDWHIELWNKCRCSIDGNKRVHITCAGLSRPSDKYHIERFIYDLCKSGFKEPDVLKMCVGYNVYVGNEICHALEGHKPNPTDIWDAEVTDYKGNTYHVMCHEAECLYPVGRWLGETLKRENLNSVEYLEREYGRKIDLGMRRLYFKDNICEVLYGDGIDEKIVMMCEGSWNNV